MIFSQISFSIMLRTNLPARCVTLFDGDVAYLLRIKAQVNDHICYWSDDVTLQFIHDHLKRPVAECISQISQIQNYFFYTVIHS